MNSKFKQALGYAFENWDMQQCLNIVIMSQDNQQYRLGAAVARYVAEKKYGIIISVTPKTPKHDESTTQ